MRSTRAFILGLALVVVQTLTGSFVLRRISASGLLWTDDLATLIVVVEAYTDPNGHLVRAETLALS